MTKLSDVLVELEKKREYYLEKSEEYQVIDWPMALHCSAQAETLQTVLEKLRWVTEV